MADFSTHLVGAAALCSFAATLAAKALDLPSEEALVLVAAGVAGGVLPDIDHESSTPTRLLFTTLGVIAALAWLFANLGRLSAVELWAIAIGVFAVVRWPAAWLFARFTVHRGALHSLAAALMCGVLTTAFASRVCDASATLAWWSGGFATFGYLVHLTLDEVYAVDVAGARIRRSFGSALKPVDTERLYGTVAVIGTTALAWSWTPDPGQAMDALRHVFGALRQGEPGLVLPR